LHAERNLHRAHATAVLVAGLRHVLEASEELVEVNMPTVIECVVIRVAGDARGKATDPVLTESGHRPIVASSEAYPSSGQGAWPICTSAY
jgi:hypothetical protein